MIARWGPYELNQATRQLTVDETVVHLEPREFDLLRYLVEHRNRVVPKTELLDELWGDQFVSEAALTTRMRAIRKAVGDSGREQHTIRTAHGTGYQFVFPLTDGQLIDASPGPDPTGRGDADPLFRVGRPAKPLVGRADLLAQLDELLGRVRLITLTGPGGIGKTHLALHAAVAQADRFTDGALLVPLVEVRHGAGLGPTLAGVLGATQQQESSPLESAMRFLERRSMLLVIDNAERLTEDVVDVVTQIAGRCPAVTVIVTSRQRLGLADETVIPVGPLATADALQLFTDHAARSGSAVDAAGAAELCGRLDGVPLALELAAARTRLLAIEDIENDLRTHLGRRSNDDDHRRRSVEAALAWSVESLEPSSRLLLSELTTLVGSFDLDAARAITDRADAADEILDLCERSLVLAEPGPDGSRFRMLEPIRLFAATSPDSLHAAKQRHLRYFAAGASGVEELFAAGELDAGITQARRLWPNLRQAITYAVELDDRDPAVELISAVSLHAEMTLSAEVVDWCRLLRDAGSGADGLEQLRTLDGVEATLLAHLGRLDEATARFAAHLGAIELSPIARRARMWLAMYADDSHRPADDLDFLLDLYRDQGGVHEVSILSVETFARAATGQESRETAERTIALLEGGGRMASVFVETALGILALWDGEFDEADRHATASFQTALDTGLPFMAIGANALRVVVLGAVGDPTLMAPRLAVSLEFAVDRGLRLVLGGNMLHAASTLVELGDRELAATVLGAWQSSEFRTTVFDGLAAATEHRLRDHFGDGLTRRLAAGRAADTADVALAAADALRSAVG